MQLDIERLDQNIFYYKGIISEPDKIIDYFENVDMTKWEDWLSTGANNVRHGFSKKVIFDHPDNSAELVSISNIIKQVVSFSLYHYKENIECKDISGPPFFDIKKYTDGADMGLHADSEDISDKRHPILSAVLYLNDNYVGGEIDFTNQNVKIKPIKGSMVIFPSIPPYYHRPMPVTSGTKYMVPFFFYEKETN